MDHFKDLLDGLVQFLIHFSEKLGSKIRFNTYWQISGPRLIPGKFIHASFMTTKLCSKPVHDLDIFLENSSRRFTKYGSGFQKLALALDQKIEISKKSG